MKRELSEARKRANQKWDAANLKRVSLAMLVSDYNAMEEHLSKRDESRNGFINRAIKTAIALDQKEQK